MREVIYAVGLKTAVGEEAASRSREFDSDMLDRILNDLSFAEGFYANRDAEFERQEKWYFRDHYEKADPVTTDTVYGSAADDQSTVENEHLVTINVPFNSVQRAHIMMTGEAPIIEALVNNQRSEKVVQFLHGAYGINSRRWGGDQMHEAIFNQLLYGWGVIRTTWQRNDWDDDDKDFKGDRPLHAFPLDVKSLLPQEVYPIPGGTYERWKAIVHRSYMKVYEVEEQYDVTLTMNDDDASEAETDDINLSEPLDPGKEVEVIDYWCWHGKSIYHAVVAHNQYVMRPTKMKYYDQLPFTIFFCGKTTSKMGEYYGLPANYALIDTVSEIEWIVNRHMRIIDLYAEPTTVIERVNDEPVGPVMPGGTIELMASERAYYLQFEGSLPDLRFLEQFFREQLEQEGFASYPTGMSGVDTVAQQQQDLIKIFKPVENAQEAYETVNAKLIGLLQRYSWDKAVTVQGRMAGEESDKAFKFAVKGSETKGARETRVKLRARFPLEELRNVGAASTLKNSRLMPTSMIMRRLLGIQDPTLARSAILEETIEEMPELAGTLVQQQLATLTKRSQIMDIVAEEVNQLTGRGEPSQMGLPASPAPLEPPDPFGNLDAEALMADAMAATGNQPDNPAPMSVPLANPPTAENPLANLSMGGMPLA